MNEPDSEEGFDRHNWHHWLTLIWFLEIFPAVILFGALITYFLFK